MVCVFEEPWILPSLFLVKEPHQCSLPWCWWWASTLPPPQDSSPCSLPGCGSVRHTKGLRIPLQGPTWKLALPPHQEKYKTKAWRFGSLFPPQYGKSPNFSPNEKTSEKEISSIKYIHKKLKKKSTNYKGDQKIFRGQWRYNLTTVGNLWGKTLQSQSQKHKPKV